jgi:NTP pyrophosphatase (non-canonical NTP hydrolase)
MDFKTLQDKVYGNAVDYWKKYNVSIDEDFALIKLYEELWEFSQALLIHKRKSRPEKFLPEDASMKDVALELADVMWMVIVNAKVLGIDLESALMEKWVKAK